MKTSVLIPLFSFILLSCNKEPVDKGAFPNPHVNIHYTDKAGNNLFTNGANGYIIDKVRTYSLINGVKSLDSAFDLYDPMKVVYNPYGWGKVYDSDTKDSVFIASVGLEVTKINYKSEHYFTTLIDLKDGVEDTMRVFVNSRKAIDSLWYNRQLLYVNPYWPEVYDMRQIIKVQKND